MAGKNTRGPIADRGVRVAEAVAVVVGVAVRVVVGVVVGVAVPVGDGVAVPTLVSCAVALSCPSVAVTVSIPGGKPGIVKLQPLKLPFASAVQPTAWSVRRLLCP